MRLASESLLMELADRFYVGVTGDDALRAMYPDADLTAAAQHLGWFLVEFWGGPITYSKARGYPSLRIRHLPFPITVELRDRWLAHMRTAMAEVAIDEPDKAKLWRWFTAEAEALVNLP
ncbi:globin [Actinocrispum sp. NPDC049592]|uniref:globin domain-containing protein n=1 Tax=Actinocrispum sp. NPDC049592 TaxID=3154835 RepID=UPI00343FBD54